ncbi:MAG: P-loop NTPase [Acetivibrio ethanolgignens]
MDQASQLRNIIKKNQQPPTAKVITVTSGKGGVGKSSISVNLAIQLQKLGNRVVIMDADFGLANIEVMLGIRPKYNLADLIFKGKRMNEIITPGPEGIGFISGGSGIQELSSLTNDQILGLNQYICLLDEIADIIIIDTGAGIGDSVMEFACTGDETILVVTPEPTSITDAYAVLKALDKRMMGKPGDYTIKMLANRVGSLAEGRELYEKLSVVVNKFLKIKVEFLGAVPQDNLLSKAVLKQSPVSISFPKAASSQSLFEIASMIGNNKIKEQKTPNGIRLLFYNLIQSKMGR